jgi:hypothetical protein
MMPSLVITKVLKEHEYLEDGAGGTSETLSTTYQTTQSHISEDSNF